MHLHKAKILINQGSFSATVNGKMKVGGVDPNVPEAPMAATKGVGVLATHNNGDLDSFGIHGVYIMGKMDGLNGSNLSFANVGDGFRPAELMAFDRKVDDGKAKSGNVIAFSRQVAANDCFNDGDTNYYSTVDRVACSMAIVYSALKHGGSGGADGGYVAPPGECGDPDPGNCNSSPTCGSWDPVACSCVPGPTACGNPLHSWDAGSCSCECTAGDPAACTASPTCGTWDDSTCSCTPANTTCPGGQSWNSGTCACVPDAPAPCPDPGNCGASPTCGTWDSNSCSCVAGDTTCPGGESWDAATCACVPDICEDPGNCDASPTCGAWDPVACECVNGDTSCPEGETWDADTCACVPDECETPKTDVECRSELGELASWDEVDCECKCMDDMGAAEAQCEINHGNSCWTSGNGCSCSDTQTPCSDGNSWDPLVCACMCSKTEADCNVGETLDVATCECIGECSTPEKLEEKQACIDAGNPYAWTEGDGYCKCYCPDQNVCENGGVWLEDYGDCKCNCDSSTCQDGYEKIPGDPNCKCRPMQCPAMTCPDFTTPTNPPECDECPDPCAECGICGCDGFLCLPCETCGNGNCGWGEDYSWCPQDCPAPAPDCGNGTCDGGETNVTCPSDCDTGDACGDGTCDGFTENCSFCPTDCGSCCGNGACDSMFGEDSFSCPSDCI